MYFYIMDLIQKWEYHNVPPPGDIKHPSSERYFFWGKWWMSSTLLPFMKGFMGIGASLGWWFQILYRSKKLPEKVMNKWLVVSKIVYFSLPKIWGEDSHRFWQIYLSKGVGWKPPIERSVLRFRFLPTINVGKKRCSVCVNRFCCMSSGWNGGFYP